MVRNEELVRKVLARDIGTKSLMVLAVAVVVMVAVIIMAFQCDGGGCCDCRISVFGGIVMFQAQSAKLQSGM